MNTRAWLLFSWAIFAVIVAMTLYVIFNFIDSAVIKMLVVALFVSLIQATFNLAKVVRDEAESKKYNSKHT